MYEDYLYKLDRHMDSERLIGHLLGPEYDEFNSELKSYYAKTYGEFVLARQRCRDAGILPQEPQFDGPKTVLVFYYELGR